MSICNRIPLYFNSALQHQIDWASDQIEVHILKDGSRIVTGYQGRLELSEL